MKISPYLIDEKMKEMSSKMHQMIQLYGPDLADQNRICVCVDHFCPKNSVKRQDSLLGVYLILR